METTKTPIIDIAAGGILYVIPYSLPHLGSTSIIAALIGKPFIPIVTEYALLLKKTDSFIIPFSIRQEGVFSVQNTDILALTWHHLIRMTMESIGGRGALKDLYDLLKEHPKAKKNPHYQERIRATLYEHPDEYIPVSKGYFRLSYPVT